MTTDDRFRRLANQIRRSGTVKCPPEDLAELVRRGLLSVNDAIPLSDQPLLCCGYTGMDGACYATPDDSEPPGTGRFVEAGSVKFICLRCWQIECDMLPPGGDPQ